MTPNSGSGAADVSIAIFAWNEERAIETTLNSVFEQSLFDELLQRGQRCEVICVTNGCTDRTPLIAAQLMLKTSRQHPFKDAFNSRVANIPERGKVNAWNKFVHELSAPQACFLFMMDADILIHRRATLWNMLRTLEQDSQAGVAVDLPCKDLVFRKPHSIATRLSLAAASLTRAAEGQLCGQLYCIRAANARRIFLPKDLAACEDGFIKVLVSTDFLAHEPWSKRIRVAPEAEHTFEAYTSPKAILKNQKRQVIGQTIVHVLIDQYLQGLPAGHREDLPTLLRAKESADPFWLKKLIQGHVRAAKPFWRLYPGLIGGRFRHLKKLPPSRRLACLPAAVAATCATLLASFLAHRSLRKGCTDYWPKANRTGLEPLKLDAPFA